MEELILKYKDLAIDNMVKTNILASIQLAYLIANENSNIEPTVLIDEVISKQELVGVSDYREACKIFCSSNREKNRFINYIESRKLLDIDNEALAIIEANKPKPEPEPVPGETSIIDDVIPAEKLTPAFPNNDVLNTPFLGAYNVIDHMGFTVGSYAYYEEALKVCNMEYERKIVDHNKTIIYTNTKPVEEKPQPKPVVQPTFIEGMSITLAKKVNGYNNSFTRIRSRVLSAGTTFYINSEKIVNGRVRLSQNKEECGTRTYLCYVNVSDLS